ncbi:hypothetical protein DFH06DRAFT_1340111 [Mycena polygramma]|nr:hypothetical protein DFH06DRAFT_1340111 [Mycena polygramma]
MENIDAATARGGAAMWYWVAAPSPHLSVHYGGFGSGAGYTRDTIASWDSAHTLCSFGMAHIWLGWASAFFVLLIVTAAAPTLPPFFCGARCQCAQLDSSRFDLELQFGFGAGVWIFELDRIWVGSWGTGSALNLRRARME